MTEEKLSKVIKDELDTGNVDIQWARRVKRNNDDNGNDDRNSKPLTVVDKLLHFNNKQDIFHEAKSREITKFYFKEDFSRET